MTRKWESIICYENRHSHYRTSRWRLAGINTRQGAENTDGGVVWLDMSRAGETVTADLYRDAALAAGDKIATGQADVSALGASAASAAPVDLAEANSSGVTGRFWIHDYRGDGSCAVQVALCVDEDLAVLWDGIDSLPGYDGQTGCGEFIRLAGEDVLAKAAAMFRDRLGGYGAAEAWFIADASRSLPDLRRIANPAQLRTACAHRALEIAIGRSHKMGADSMYSRLRDYHRAEYDRATASLVLAVRAGKGGASSHGRAGAMRQSRV
jgi:hypothetical protein